MKTFRWKSLLHVLYLVTNFTIKVSIDFTTNENYIPKDFKEF